MPAALQSMVILIRNRILLMSVIAGLLSRRSPKAKEDVPAIHEAFTGLHGLCFAKASHGKASRVMRVLVSVLFGLSMLGC